MAFRHRLTCWRWAWSWASPPLCGFGGRPRAERFPNTAARAMNPGMDDPAPDPCRLYLITPPVLPDGFADQLAAALDAGDVACLQLRLKGASPEAVKRAVDALMPITQARDVAFILNDD